jgi:20S proteasome subunit alpha 7
MSGAGTGYDLSSTTYSPEGKIFQIEYAAKAIENAPTVVGLKCKDGIVVGVEKPVHSRLVVPGSNRYTYAITKHSGILVTGVLPDGRSVVSRARQEAGGYQENYGREIGATALATRVAAFMHLFTLYGGYRPFGVTAVIAGLEEGQPRLYMAEPSGDFYEYFACSAGKSNQLCKTELDKLQLEGLSAQEAVYFIAKM